MPAFSVSFSFLDPQSRKGVYFKQDGQRFGSDRTVKFCTDVKYEIRVTVRPPVAPLRSLIIGGDELMPDSSEDKSGQSSYLFSWFTNGHSPTGSRRRIDLPFTFRFEGAEFGTKFQSKFYSVTSGTHLTWGTEVKQIQLEGRAEFEGGATQHLTPTNTTFI